MASIRYPKAHLALANTILTLRKEAKLTQDEFGAAVNRNQKWVTAVETGHRPIFASEIPVLAKALKVTPLKFWKRFLAILAT